MVQIFETGYCILRQVSTCCAWPLSQVVTVIAAALAAYDDASNGISLDNGYPSSCALHSSKVAAAIFSSSECCILESHPTVVKLARCSDYYGETCQTA
jgi:hypothetical protein